MFEIFYYYLKFSGAELFSLFFVLLVIYFFYKLMHRFFNVIFSFKDHESLTQIFKKTIFAIIVSLVAFFSIGLILEKIIVNAKVAKIVFFSDIFLRADTLVFNTYLPFWFQSINNSLKPLFDALAPYIIFSYYSLAFLSGILFFTFFVIKPDYFYKAFLGFIITFLISMPLWFLFPAVSPFDAYVDNIISTPASQYLQTTLSDYRPNKFLESFFERIKGLNRKNGGVFFATTTMPSMHIAWSVLLLYFGVKLRRYLAIILVPWFLLNALGTVYTLQHYTIDIPAGLVVGIISIWLAEIISRKITPKFFIL